MATPKQEKYLDDLRWAYQDCDEAVRLLRDGRQSHELGTREASRSISEIVKYARSSWPWQVLSKQSIVAEMAWAMQKERGKQSFSRRDFDALERRLSPVLQTEVLTFSANGGYGGRVPLSVSEAAVKLRQVMSRVQREVTERLQKRDGSQSSDSSSQSRDSGDSSGIDWREKLKELEREREQQAREHRSQERYNEMREREQQAREHRSQERYNEMREQFTDERFEQDTRESQSRNSTGNDWSALYRRINQARRFAEDRNLDSLYSMRVAIDARKAFQAGLPPDAILSSITADWADDTRRQFDGYRDEPKPQPNKYAEYGEAPDGVHAVGPYVEKLISANVPTYMHGPAGTGKSTAAKLAAERLGLAYYELNLAGAMASAIRGRDTMTGFVESVFIKAYRDGGVLAMEEMDAAHPNVLTAINNAIANGHWFNEATGTEIKRHPDFRIVGTGNTLGHGATKDFSGRNRLDGATLDRFRVGRVEVLHDPKLEQHILSGMGA